MRPLLVTLLLLSTGAALAQVPDEDAEGCKDSKVLSRVTGCKIINCRHAEFDSVELPVAAEPTGLARVQSFEGELEIVEYICGSRLSQLQVIRNAETALKSSGYKVSYQRTESPQVRMLTTRKGSRWVALSTATTGEFPLYTLTVVKERPIAQNSESMAAKNGPDSTSTKTINPTRSRPRPRPSLQGK